jgi:hypothetical protein
MSISFVSTQVLEVEHVLNADSIGKVPALSITQPVDPIPEIKTILQPSVSYGGMAAQSEAEFIAHMAVRTGYKNRAITPLDIEAILLSEFKALYKVSAYKKSCQGESTQRVVEVTLIPWTNIGDEKPMLPVASVNLMLAVLDRLNNIGLPGTRYRVTNAEFVQMRITCTVTFSVGGEAQQCAAKLNEDLRFYLSPWLINNPIDAIGTRPNASAVNAFIRSRSYIKNVERVQIDMLRGSYWKDDDNTVPVADRNRLIVSADQHEIKWKTPGASNETELSLPGLRIGETFYMTN